MTVPSLLPPSLIRSVRQPGDPPGVGEIWLGPPVVRSAPLAAAVGSWCVPWGDPLDSQHHEHAHLHFRIRNACGGKRANVGSYRRQHPSGLCAVASREQRAGALGRRSGKTNCRGGGTLRLFSAERQQPSRLAPFNLNG